jgi:menaquinone-dependent protoporphyrinogen oxidase
VIVVTRVLIAYGSTNGSTAGIAAWIADVLRADGLTAEVVEAGRVQDVGGYDAVVLGGALYSGLWHRDARRFARRHARALAGCPVWLFSSGPLSDTADSSPIPAVAQAAAAQRSLSAREHVTFGGRLTADAKGFIARAMVRNGRGGDFRNPDRVTAWAREIAGALARDRVEGA